ncbi:MAG: hypothetical protein WDO70_03100 [Alphaproteobacteria bacterium]
MTIKFHGDTGGILTPLSRADQEFARDMINSHGVECHPLTFNIRRMESSGYNNIHTKITTVNENGVTTCVVAASPDADSRDYFRRLTGYDELGFRAAADMTTARAEFPSVTAACYKDTAFFRIDHQKKVRSGFLWLGHRTEIRPSYHQMDAADFTYLYAPAEGQSLTPALAPYQRVEALLTDARNNPEADVRYASLLEFSAHAANNPDLATQARADALFVIGTSDSDANVRSEARQVYGLLTDLNPSIKAEASFRQAFTARLDTARARIETTLAPPKLLGPANADPVFEIPDLLPEPPQPRGLPAAPSHAPRG